MSLRVGGHSGLVLGDVKSIEVHGRPGCGTYPLYLRLKVVVNNLDETAVLNQLSCRIESGNKPFALGVYEGSPVLEWPQHISDTYLGFNFYLTGSQLNALELARHSNDLELGVWLSGVSHYKGKADSFCDKGEFKILKQDWLRALGQMDYKKTLLFELAMPSNLSVADDVIDCLERAQNHISNGAYQEAVGLCRQVIESIEKHKNDKNEARSAIKVYGENRQGMSISQRMLFLREAIKNITHLGNHSSEDGFSRYQAQSVLGMTVALLSSPEVGVVR